MAMACILLVAQDRREVRSHAELVGLFKVTLPRYDGKLPFSHTGLTWEKAKAREGD